MKGHVSDRGQQTVYETRVCNTRWAGFYHSDTGYARVGIEPIGAALAQAQQWIELNERYRYQRLELEHYGLEQRWLVIYSEGAYERAAKTVAKAQKKNMSV